MSNQHEIMIVEDSQENILFASQILEDNGYNYSVACNGDEALEAMKKKRPDLILLDIMMPRKSGMTVFKKMKNDPELKNIPIIIVSGASEVTGVDMKTGEQQAKKGYDDDFSRDFGAVLHEKLKGMTPDGFIEKPIDPPALISKIKEFLS